MKIKELLGVAIIFLIVFSFYGCEPDPKIEYRTDPTLIYRAESIFITVGNKGSIRVEGTLTADEWNGVPEKIKIAIEAANLKTIDKDGFGSVFSRQGFTIIITKGINNTYMANNATTLYISLKEIESNNFVDKIIEAIIKMDEYLFPAVG